MIQEELLSNVPVSRKTDPKSSKMAEVEINESGTRATQQRAVLKLVETFPGATSLELSTLCDLDRYQLARRLADLHSAGLVRKGFIRHCTVGKRKAIEWYAPADWARKVND